MTDSGRRWHLPKALLDQLRSFRGIAFRCHSSVLEFCSSFRRFLHRAPGAARLLPIFRRLVFVLVPLSVLLLFLWSVTSFLPRYLDPNPTNPRKLLEDKQWINSSPHWLDRQACRWFSLCGVHHLAWDPAALPPHRPSGTGGGPSIGLELRSLDFAERRQNDWKTSLVRPSPLYCKSESNISKPIPEYVLAHAPLVHLHPEENFWPADIAEHIRHMTPDLDEKPLNQSISLSTLHLLNKKHGNVFLTSKENVERRPEWLHSHVGIPEPWDNNEDSGGEEPSAKDSTSLQHSGESESWSDISHGHSVHGLSDPQYLSKPLRDSEPFNKPIVGRQHQKPIGNLPTHGPRKNGFSEAPSVLILVDKGSGIVDAFWFFFYSYNLGQTVLNIRFGNHVGDWEHCMIRFQNGTPRGIFLSEHSGGQAYSFHAVEKRGVRPVIYSAVGSHAMYANPGDHPYVLPFNILKDVTGRGPLWDPAKNKYSYWYNPEKDLGRDHYHDVGSEIESTNRPCQNTSDSLIPTAENPTVPTSWFHFAGTWGDKLYSLADVRQWRLFNQYHYDIGPYGPKFKRLDRQKICSTDRCQILHKVDPGQTWYG